MATLNAVRQLALYMDLADIIWPEYERRGMLWCVRDTLRTNVPFGIYWEPEGPPAERKTVYQRLPPFKRRWPRGGF